MSLLVMQDVTKRFVGGRRETTAIRDVTLDLAAGELVTVFGLRRAGRSTLLRLAAGILQPDEGTVTFAGRDLAHHAAIGHGIGWLTDVFDPGQGRTVADQVALPLLLQGAPRKQARQRAVEALANAGAGDCATFSPRELHPHERVRAGIARAMVTHPRVLLLDEPTNGVGVTHAEPIHQLIRNIAADGVAVLMTTDTVVAGANRCLSIQDGRVRGSTTPQDADVVPIRREA